MSNGRGVYAKGFCPPSQTCISSIFIPVSVSLLPNSSPPGLVANLPVPPGNQALAAAAAAAAGRYPQV